MPECIDAKSQELMTPLLVAFRLHRVEAARILIEAGADQTARDNTSNNIVHRLLQNPKSNENEKMTEEIPALLNLVDKRLLPTLFLERSSEYPGSLTPLAQFVNRPSRTTAYHHHHRHTYDEEVVQTVLKYSKGAELNSINGEGHTPLHVSVRDNDEMLAKIILEKDPDLLLRENATGRTPFEMAEDRHIASFVSNPPDLGTGHRANRTKRIVAAGPICERDPKEFVADPDHDARSSEQKIWELLQETKAKLNAGGHAQRRLVTLNEANEVAKRLAASKLDRRRYRGRQQLFDDDNGDDEEQQAAMDEVQMWLH